MASQSSYIINNQHPSHPKKNPKHKKQKKQTGEDHGKLGIKNLTKNLLFLFFLLAQAEGTFGALFISTRESREWTNNLVTVTQLLRVIETETTEGVVQREKIHPYTC